MKRPLHEPCALGFWTDSAGSGVSIRGVSGGVDDVGGNIYRLARTAPTA